MRNKHDIPEEKIRGAWQKWISGENFMPQLAKELGCPTAILYHRFVKFFGKETVRHYGLIARKHNPGCFRPTIESKYGKEETEKLFKRWKESGLSLRGFSSNKELCPIAESSARKLFFKYCPAEYEALVEEHLASARTYQKGRTFEYCVRDEFRGKGYFVLRSPRSGGVFDLLALKRGEILMVECKVEGTSGLHPRDKRRIDALIELANSLGAKALLAWREKEKWRDKKTGRFLRSVRIKYRKLN